MDRLKGAFGRATETSPLFAGLKMCSTFGLADTIMSRSSCVLYSAATGSYGRAVCAWDAAEIEHDGSQGSQNSWHNVVKHQHITVTLCGKHPSFGGRCGFL